MIVGQVIKGDHSFRYEIPKHCGLMDMKNVENTEFRLSNGFDCEIEYHRLLESIRISSRQIGVISS